MKKIKKGNSLHELTKRFLFAVPAALLFIYITWLGEWYFNALMILIAFLIIDEMIDLFKKMATPSDNYFPYSFGLWVMVSFTIPHAFEIGLILLVIFISIQTFNSREHSISELVTTLFTGLYAPLGILCLILIRAMGDAETGFILTVTVMLMIWGSDVFAYFGGKSLGKRKLAPNISPNKTVEGFIFGYAGCFAGLLIAIFTIPHNTDLTLTAMLPLVLLIGTFGPIGDLIESKIKRKAGVKDSATILPGHGGFFDRFDAVLLVAPVSYVYLKFIAILGYATF